MLQLQIYSHETYIITFSQLSNVKHQILYDFYFEDVIIRVTFALSK